MYVLVTHATISQWQSSEILRKSHGANALMHRNRIFVPECVVNGGFDVSYDDVPYDVQLYGLVSEQEHQDAIVHTTLSSRLEARNSIML